MRNNTTYLIILTAIVFLYACKNLQTVPYQKKSGKEKTQLFSQKKDSILRHLNINSLSFKSLNYSAKVNYQYKGHRESGKLYIRMLKDSLIWISVRKFNLEALRVLINQDSIKVINRIHKTYYTQPFEFINKTFFLDIDFNMLEALLIGNPTDYNLNQKKFVRENKNTSDYIISTIRVRKYRKGINKNKDKIKNPGQIIWLNKDTKKVSKLFINNPKKKKVLTCIYSDFKALSNLSLLPHAISFTIPVEQYISPEPQLISTMNPTNPLVQMQDSNIFFAIDISKGSINKLLKYPFSIPKNYKYIE